MERLLPSSPRRRRLRSTEQVITCNAGGHEAGDVAGNHCPQGHKSEVFAARRSHGAQSSQLDADCAEVAEAAQRVRRYKHRTLLIMRTLHRQHSKFLKKIPTNNLRNARQRTLIFNKFRGDLTAYEIPYSHHHPIRKILFGIKSIHTDCFADAIFHHRFQFNSLFLAESGLSSCRLPSIFSLYLFPKRIYEDNWHGFYGHGCSSGHWTDGITALKERKITPHCSIENQKLLYRPTKRKCLNVVTCGTPQTLNYPLIMWMHVWVAGNTM